MATFTSVLPAGAVTQTANSLTTPTPVATTAQWGSAPAPVQSTTQRPAAANAHLPYTPVDGRPGYVYDLDGKTPIPAPQSLDQPPPGTPYKSAAEAQAAGWEWNGNTHQWVATDQAFRSEWQQQFGQAVPAAGFYDPANQAARDQFFKDHPNGAATVNGPDGQPYLVPYPSWWTPDQKNGFSAQATDPKNIPQGWSQHDDGLSQDVTGALLGPTSLGGQASRAAGAVTQQTLGNPVIGNPGATDNPSSWNLPVVGGGGLGGIGGGGNIPTTAGLESDLARARALRDSAIQQAQNFQGFAAPQINQIGLPPAQQAQAAQIAAAQQVAAAQIDPIERAAAERIAAAQIGSTAQASASDVTAAQIAATNQAGLREVGAAHIEGAGQAGAQNIEAAQIGPAPTTQAAQIAPVDRASATLMQAAPLDVAAANALRAQQLGLIGRYNDVLDGRAPSLAELQLKQANDQAIGDQLAFAASARGANLGAVQREAAMNAAKIQQQNALAMAMLRAQEEQQARQGLGSAIEAGRGADINVATTQAQLEQQARQGNQQASNQVTLANALAANQAAIQQAQIDQQNGAQNADRIADLMKQRAQLQQQAALANQQTQADISKFNVGEFNKVNTENAQLQQQSSLANQQAYEDVAKFNASQANATAQQNATLQQQASLANQSTRADVSKFNVGQLNTTAQQNATLAQQANLANQQTAADIAKANAAAANTRATQQAQLQQQAATGNADRTLAQSTSQAGLTTDVSKFNAGQTNQQTVSGAQINADISKANQQAAVQTQGQNITQQKNLYDVANTSLDTSVRGETAKFAPQQAEADREMKLIGALATGLGAAGAGAAVSDRRAKTNVRDGAAAAEAVLRHLEDKRFEYRGDDADQHLGVMAQDLERTPWGRSIVDDRPDGKRVDGAQAALMALALVTHVNRKLTQMQPRRVR